MKSIISIFVFMAINSFMYGQWTTSGNSITDPNTEFLGTSSAQDLVMKASNLEAVRITTNQRVGVGTTNPGNKLEVLSGSLGGVRLSNIPSASILSTNGDGDIIANTYVAHANGDIKFAFVDADHDGWVLLGPTRSIATLTESQQAAAASLGLSVFLPDATNKYFSQSSAAGDLGSESGATNNQLTIEPTNLPDIKFNVTTGSESQNHTHSGTTSTNGSHQHDYSYLNNLTSASINANGYLRNQGESLVDAVVDHKHTISTVNQNVNHNHTYTFTSLNNLGVTPFVITPSTITANAFIYLGN